jgi:hypothetical protein
MPHQAALRATARGALSGVRHPTLGEATAVEPDVQAAIVAALERPAAYPHAAPDVTHVQTHISHVFLVGLHAYKMKKAVVFPFLDFGTRAAREHFCREEVRLNRRLASGIYLDVLPVVRAQGSFVVGGAGEPVDWLVHMVRLPAERSLVALVRARAVSGPTLATLAARLARFHAEAPVVAGGTLEMLTTVWNDNLDGVRPFVGRHLAEEEFEVLADFGATFVTRHDAVLRARPQLGHVREGHGDLRADHVYVLDEAIEVPGLAPVPPGIHVVDCIEFSATFRAIDVAADVSFLAMELEQMDRKDLADAFVRAYAETANDQLVPALIPYYACHRATVRGKVEALACEEPELGDEERAAAAARARVGFVVAGRFAWRSGDPVVIACAGLSGTGKSTVAAALGAATGFDVVSSDVLRKLAPSSATQPLYAAAARRATYARVRREVERLLAAGNSVIVDATLTSRAERDRLARSARGYGRRWLFVQTTADEAVIRRRLDARDHRSVSDARWDVYLRQRDEHDGFVEGEPVLTIDTTAGMASERARLLRSLWAWRQNRPVRLATT